MAGVLLGPREETPERLWHPEYRGGWRMWTDGSTEAVMAKVRDGDPVKGWEGDPRLALYATEHPSGKIVWELCRLEHDGQYRLVARSQPGVPFDERIIDHLVTHDRRRGYDVHADVATNNERVQRAQDFRYDDLDGELDARMRHTLRGEL